MKTDFYTEANCQPEPREVLSPSGRTRLLIRQYSTQKGCWKYSRGTLYRVSDGAEIGDIKRNYSFIHSWVEKDGQEFLISGRSYMNQCIINCDEGKEIEVSDDGAGFCWVDAHASPDGNLLVVGGCYWAASYEFKFFDFTDPSNGWPELPLMDRSEYDRHKGDLKRAKHAYLPHDEQAPEFNADGSITVCTTAEIYIPTGQREEEISLEQMNQIGEACDDENNWNREVVVRYTLRRHGDVLVIEDTTKP